MWNSLPLQTFFFMLLQQSFFYQFPKIISSISFPQLNEIFGDLFYVRFIELTDILRLMLEYWPIFTNWWLFLHWDFFYIPKYYFLVKMLWISVILHISRSLCWFFVVEPMYQFYFRHFTLTMHFTNNSNYPIQFCTVLFSPFPQIFRIYLDKVKL